MPNKLITKDSKVFYTLVTDKDSEFTGAIAQNAIEQENLLGLASNKIRITGISIQSDESLDYRLILFNKDAFANTDLDVDDFASEIELDIPSYGFRIAGANQYYLVVNGLDIPYEDQDETYELHAALQNLSAAAKTAGAAGEVVVMFTYEVRD